MQFPKFIINIVVVAATFERSWQFHNSPKELKHFIKSNPYHISEFAYVHVTKCYTWAD